MILPRLVVKRFATLWFAIFVGWSALSVQATSIDGESLYGRHCATCHESGAGHAPPRAQLRGLKPEEIVVTLTRGSMQVQGTELSEEERRSVAAYLSRHPFGAQQVALPAAHSCTQPVSDLDLNASSWGAGWNGWGVDLANTRYQPHPGLAAADVSRLKVKWAYALSGRYAIGQPTVVGNRVYVTQTTGAQVSDTMGKVTALDARSGCELWTFETKGAVRTPVVVAALPKGSTARFAAFFGGNATAVQYALDAETGKLLWQTKVDEHPFARLIGAASYYDGRLYVPVSSHEEIAPLNDKYRCCTFRGSVVALDIASGKMIWKAYGIPKSPAPFRVNSAGTQMFGPAGGAIWSSPTIDTKRGLIYAATGNSYTDVDTESGSDSIVAFDIKTGARVWANQVTPNDNFVTGCSKDKAGKGNCPEVIGPDFDFGSPPILWTLPSGERVLIAGQKSGVVYGLDPDNRGKTLWQTRVGKGSPLGGIQWGMAADDENVYVPVSDLVALQHGTPGLYALDLATGRQVWSVPTPEVACTWSNSKCQRAQGAAAAAIPGIVFSGALDGHLRAYAVEGGRIVWDFDTAVEAYTVNGIRAEGGSIDGGGPTIADGVVYINSGYGAWGKAGRLLIAFSVDGK